MKLGCYYRAFPGGPIIKSMYDYDTQTVDGVPSDIIKLNNDPALYQFMHKRTMYHPTSATWANIATTYGLFSDASIVIGDAMYHTFAITPTATFVYGFDGNEIDKKIFRLNNDQLPLLFPQEYKTIGFIKTYAEAYEWLRDIARFNLFKYNNKWCYIYDNEIKEFPYSFDEHPDYCKMSTIALAKTTDNVYALYQSGGVNKYFEIN